MKKIIKKTIILSFFCLFSIGNVLAETGTYSELHFSVLKNDPVTAVQVIQQNPAAIASFDREGQTPLHLAIKRNNLLVLKAMLDKDLNVNVNIKNKDGETPLLYASKLDNINAAKLLLERDVDVYAQDTYGKDALYFSNSNENEALTKLLMAKLNKNKVNKPSDLAGVEAKQREDQINEAMKRVKVEELNNEDIQDSPPLLAVEEEHKNIPQEVDEEVEPISTKQVVESPQNPIIENSVSVIELEDKTHVLNKQLTEKDNEIQKLQKQLKATQEAQMVYAFNDSKVVMPKEVLFVEPNKKPIDEVEQSAIMFNGYNEIKPEPEFKGNQVEEKKQEQTTEEVKSNIIIPKKVVSEELLPKVKVLNNTIEDEDLTPEPVIKESSKSKKETNTKFFENKFILIVLLIFVSLGGVLVYFYNKKFNKNKEITEIDLVESEKDKKDRIRAILNKQNRFDNDR